MNREQRLEMVGRLAEVPSVELKMNIPADQRLALSGLQLDTMRGRLREVYFFDTPDLTLYRDGLVTRARRTQGVPQGTRKAGAVRRAVTGERPLERLFTKEQRRFFADHARPGSAGTTSSRSGRSWSCCSSGCPRSSRTRPPSSNGTTRARSR